MKYYNAKHRFFVKPGTHYDNETWRPRRCAETGILRMNVIDKYSRSRVVFLKEICCENLALVVSSDGVNPFDESAALVSEGEQIQTKEKTEAESRADMPPLKPLPDLNPDPEPEASEPEAPDVESCANTRPLDLVQDAKIEETKPKRKTGRPKGAKNRKSK